MNPSNLTTVSDPNDLIGHRVDRRLSRNRTSPVRIDTVKVRSPFILENIYRENAARATNGDLSDPEAVLAPILDRYFHQREKFFRSARETVSDSRREWWELEYKKPWWRLMPMMLPWYQSDHMYALAYALYRLMTTGNMTFLVGKELGDALFVTDFTFRMDELHFPSDTFIVYYRDSSMQVYRSPLTYIFVDRVEFPNNSFELRMVCGWVDKDGDCANSGFLTFAYPTDYVVNSSDIFAIVEKQKVSHLTKVLYTDEHRETLRTLLSAFFNFLLYLNNVDDTSVVNPPNFRTHLRQLKSPKKRRRIEKDMRNQTLYRYTYVGRRYEARTSSPTSGFRRRLDHHVLVRGHWRHQWIGKKRDDEGNHIPGMRQKLIWIEPFWKGPDVPDDKVTVRVVK